MRLERPDSSTILLPGPRRWTAAILVVLAAACASGGGDSGGDSGGGGGTGGGGGRQITEPGDTKRLDDGSGAGNGGGGRRGGGSGNRMNVTPVFTVRNLHALPRTQTVRASVPFPKGARFDLENVGVRGIQVAWLPLQKWPDGSVRIAQVQFTDEFAGGELKRYEVVKDVKPIRGPFEPNDWVARLGGSMRLGARVRDTFDVPYEAVVQGPGEVLQETYLVRVTRHRLYHRARAAAGIGRDYLSSTFYVTEFRDQPIVWVDWILGNDYLGADDPQGSKDPNLHPLGPVDVNRAEFLVTGVTEAKPYLADLHAVRPGVRESTGWTSFEVMRDTWLEDGQTRRYRFVLRFEHPGAKTEVKLRWKRTFDAMVEEPLLATPTLETWQDTGAFGLLGGPIDGPSDAAARARAEYASWRGRNHFGTWGSFGDPKYSHTTGTPRNGPVTPTMLHVAQAESHRLLVVLEQKAWAQAQRPYHLYGLRVGAEQDILLWDSPPYIPGGRDLSKESLGRRALWRNDPYRAYRTRVVYSGSGRAHGWNWYDHEHWTTDLLFDYWTMTGDAWAKEELRQLGESLKGLLRLRKYATATIRPARAEGWCMQGFVQAYLATGDDAIKTYALRRVREIVDPQRKKSHPSRVLFIQDGDPRSGLPSPHKFFFPWQHGAVLYGYLAAYDFFGDLLCLQIAEDVVPMLDYSWVRNFQDPKFGLVREGLRYTVPTEYRGRPVPANYFDKWPNVGVLWGSHPLGGAHVMLAGGLFVLADRTANPAIRRSALHYGSLLFGTPNDHKRWNKWFALVDEKDL